MKNIRLIAVLFLSVLPFSTTVAQTLSTRPKPAAPSAAPVATVLPTEDTVNSYLFQMFGYDAAITWKVNDIHPSLVPGLAEIIFTVSGPHGSSQNRLLITSDGKYAISGDVLPFGAKPFADAREKLEKSVTGPAKGPANAAVTIVEFSDMQCPHCQKAATIIDQLLAQEADVRFVFQNFPLPIHNWAEKAAGWVDCVGRVSNEAVFKFIDKAFADQTNITEANLEEKYRAIATESGVSADETATCAAKPETKDRVQASIALGKSLGVSATPALFINGRMVSGSAPVEILKKITDFQVSQAKGNDKDEKATK